jgi:hypothetical protein
MGILSLHLRPEPGGIQEVPNARWRGSPAIPEEEAAMPLMIYHLLRGAQDLRGRPVTLAEVEAHAREVLPLAEHNVQNGLQRLAAVGLVGRVTVDSFIEEEREFWGTQGDVPVERLAARHPDLYKESFWYFLISQQVAGRPLPPREVIRTLREVAGKSPAMPTVTDILRHLDARPA